jgi:S-adenosylmethionine synthetase
VKSIGYEQEGFHWRNAEIQCYIHGQSGDIAQGVDAAANKDEGAGDQGIMFGYACSETDDYMPAPIYYAHRLLHELAKARHAGTLPELGPDAKSQVTLLYENGRPVKATSLVLSTQHVEDASQERIREIVRSYAERILPSGWMPPEDEFYVNPTGRFVTGGPMGDAGLTGRKIIVDSYGGMARHGGGAFSGKDPTKVDRSAAYAARWVAKNVVAAGLADRFEVEVAYGIGIARPVSLSVDSFGTGTVADDEILKLVERHFDLRPASIIAGLELRRPIYRQTAAYGHFGREDLDLPWERTDKAALLAADAGLPEPNLEPVSAA